MVVCKLNILLQSAWALIDAGYKVTIVSERWASLESRITSQIAGALYVVVYDALKPRVLNNGMVTGGSGPLLCADDTQMSFPSSCRRAGA